MKKAIAVLLSAVMMVTMLSSCCCIPSGALSGLSGDALVDYVKEYLLVGTWVLEEDSEIQMVLEKDGAGELKSESTSLDLTWSVEDGLLYVSVSVLGYSQTLYDGVEFDVTFDSLVVTSNATEVTFYKQ